MKQELVQKRVELQALLSKHWQTLVEIHFPKVSQFEYRSGSDIIRVYNEFKPDGSIRAIKLGWLGKKDKLVKSAEIDTLIDKLKKL
jgi:hypothetical protein